MQGNLNKARNSAPYLWHTCQKLNKYLPPRYPGYWGTWQALWWMRLAYFAADQLLMPVCFAVSPSLLVMNHSSVCRRWSELAAFLKLKTLQLCSALTKVGQQRSQFLLFQVHSMSANTVNIYFTRQFCVFRATWNEMKWAAPAMTLQTTTDHQEKTLHLLSAEGMYFI